MAAPPKECLRALTSEERATLERVGKAGSERQDRARRATALLAVAAGRSFRQAASVAGFRSGTAVAGLVGRFNKEGLAALAIASGRGRRATYDPAARAQIVATAQRDPDRKRDGCVGRKVHPFEARRSSLPEYLLSHEGVRPNRPRRAADILSANTGGIYFPRSRPLPTHRPHHHPGTVTIYEGAPGLRHFHAPDNTGTPGWRADHERPPCASRIASPHDPEARFATKRETGWPGYTVHLTETCDADLPHLITAVQTTAATVADSSVIAAVHAELAEAGVLPQEHRVDAGYLDADNLVASRPDHGVDLVGPPLADTHWQARTAGALAIECFALDWEARRATCPQGHASGKWSETHDPYGAPSSTMRFAPAACLPCPRRTQCTRSAQDARRLTRRPQAQHLALRAARARQATPAFATRYAARAGIAGTSSQGVRAFGLRQARYIGLAKTIPTEYPALDDGTPARNDHRH